MINQNELQQHQPRASERAAQATVELRFTVRDVVGVCPEEAALNRLVGGGRDNSRRKAEIGEVGKGRHGHG